MSKWKLRKLEIDSFKVFEEFSGSFDNDLVVLDGPNGFGKTSIFDAIQLLLCGNIPRIIALFNSLKGNKTKQYERNLYWNNKSNSNIKIKAEFYCDDKVIFLMRMAELKELEDKRNNKPLSFDIFKLYELISFDDIETANLILNEKKLIKDIFGENFLSNFSVLNYISQDNNSVIVPDTSNDKQSRFDQISHLIKLDKVNKKISELSALDKSRKKRLKELEGDISSLNEEISLLKLNIQSDASQVKYQRLSKVAAIPQWDKEEPIVSSKKEDYGSLIDDLELLNNATIQVDEIELRIKNNHYNDLVEKTEFSLAIYLGNHFGQYNALVKQKESIDSYKSQIKVLNLNEAKITLEQLQNLTLVSVDSRTNLKSGIEERVTLKKTTDGYIAELTEIGQLRVSIIEKQHKNESECLLCGFDYKTNALLLDALKLKFQKITAVIETHNDSYKRCLESLKILLKLGVTTLTTQLDLLESGFDALLLQELEKNKSKQNNIELITLQLSGYGVILPTKYSADEKIKGIRLEEFTNKVLSLRQEENDTLQNGVLDFFKQWFNTIDELKKITVTDVKNKKSYLILQYNLTINSELKNKEEKLKTHIKGQDNLVLLGVNLTSIIKNINTVKNTYSSQTIGQVESLFHIYSGRLIQNYQRGLGLFIDTEETSSNKAKNLHFFTADGSSYDAVLSMSSGQVAALTLAFFLSLNRKYANTAFILIDDPTQCMDEINIASLSDLLRIELRDRQVIISTHEQEVSDYLRYRYLRGGLKADSIHLQNKYVETLTEKTK
jgi:exonuclease SbcC